LGLPTAVIYSQSVRIIALAIYDNFFQNYNLTYKTSAE